MLFTSTHCASTPRSMCVTLLSELYDGASQKNIGNRGSISKETQCAVCAFPFRFTLCFRDHKNPELLPNILWTCNLCVWMHGFFVSLVLFFLLCLFFLCVTHFCKSTNSIHTCSPGSDLRKLTKADWLHSVSRTNTTPAVVSLQERLEKIY